MSNQPPIEVPQGAIRLNTDSQKLEFFAQDRWYEMATNTPTLNGGSRGFILGGYPGYSDKIERFDIATAGNGVDFGDLAYATSLKANVSDRTRLCTFGDYNSPDTTMINSIEFITMASDGDTVDFGDMSQGAYSAQPVNNSTRGVFMGGTNVYNSVSGTINNIEFITIQSTGNSVDFGDMTTKTSTGQGFSSPTRGVTAGGTNPGGGGRQSLIQFITTSTLGNTQDFGDLLIAAAFTCANTASNSIRGLITNNNTSPGTYQNTIQFVTIATTGNANDFGDLIRGSEWCCGMASPTRAVFHNPGGNANQEHMEYSQIMTAGNSVDFGDISQDLSRTSAGSNGHGGL